MDNVDVIFLLEIMFGFSKLMVEVVQMFMLNTDTLHTNGWL